MKIKYSKIKQFNLVTNENFFNLQQKLDSDIDFDTRLDVLERLSLGLYLIKEYPLDQARKEYRRLMKDDDERYEIIDNVDLDELIAEVIA